MTGKLSEMQLTWLRGLSIDGQFITMSASELGNPEVSLLQSRGLIAVRSTTFAGREWTITDAGRDAMTAASGSRAVPLHGSGPDDQ